MNERHYLTGRDNGPGSFRRLVDQRMVPAAINGASSIEAVLEVAARRARAQPVAAFALALGAGFLVYHLTRSGRR